LQCWGWNPVSHMLSKHCATLCCVPAPDQAFLGLETSTPTWQLPKPVEITCLTKALNCYSVKGTFLKPWVLYLTCVWFITYFLFLFHSLTYNLKSSKLSNKIRKISYIYPHFSI
jgi:hypothetical protein